MSDELKIDAHVAELISGYLDGELTQQESQRVQLHIERCSSCSSELDDIRSLQRKIGAANLSNLKQNMWRETMDDVTVKASRGIGWLLLIGGVLIAVGIAVIEILRSADDWSLLEQLIVGGIYGGLLLIFISVLRQRLIERKKDRYKDVEI